MGKFIDLTGQRFGRLEVLAPADDYVSPKGYIAKRWLCMCDCGNKTIVTAEKLKSGHTKSCGCYHNEIAKSKEIKHRKYNIENSETKKRLYRIRSSMKTRCYNKNYENYKNYGGRGITICDEWKDNFQAFYDWAIKNGYKKGLTIDRIDNNKGYSPENCRWATHKEQTLNRRCTQFLLFNGENRTLVEWAKETGINYQTLNYRKKAGKTPAEILKTKRKDDKNEKIRFNR